MGLRANVIWWVECNALCTLSCHTASRKHLLHCLATWNFNPFLLPTCSDFGHHQPSDAHLLPAVWVLWVSEALPLTLSLYNALPQCGINMSDSRYEGTVTDASSSHCLQCAYLSVIMLSSALRVCSDLESFLAPSGVAGHSSPLAEVFTTVMQDPNHPVNCWLWSQSPQVCSLPCRYLICSWPHWLSSNWPQRLPDSESFQCLTNELTQGVIVYCYYSKLK